MDVQQNILRTIKNDTNDLLKSHIYPSISQLIELKMKEETDKILSATNILGDVFPKPNGTGMFRCCGKCCRCLETGSIFTEAYINECNKIQYKQDKHNITSQLRDDEYILLCSAYGCLDVCYPVKECTDATGTRKTYHVREELRGEYITNYGSVVSLHSNYSTKHSLHIYYSNTQLLTEEFIIYYIDFIHYSSSGMRKDDSRGTQRLTHTQLDKKIKEYNSYNPKASELYRLQKQKENIETMTGELQLRETLLVKNINVLAEDMIEFEKEKTEFEKEKVAFEKTKQIHKNKSKSLLKRENSVFIKESIKSVHQELTDISYTLSDVIDLLDVVDPIIEQRVEQTIQKLCGLVGEQGQVVEAVEIL